MSDEDIIVYVATKNLVSAGGPTYQDTLKDLVKAGIIKSFEEVTALRLDKAKAIHIEAVLEGFYDVPVTTTIQSIKGEK